MTLPPAPERHRHTMERLEALKRVSPKGTDYWMAREIGSVLGYQVWARFEPVIERARTAMAASGNIDPSHHIAQTSRLMGRGKGAQASGIDFFLTRGACYLIAMNGDTSKPEIAAAQLYFAARTRQSELADALAADEKRLELRDKVSDSMKRVSGVAQSAGVSSNHQGIFHEQRYRGLYKRSSAQVKSAKGLAPKDNLFDRAGPMELSAHDFQMNLAADIISKEGIRGEQAAIAKNLSVAEDVRSTIERQGGTLPENLPLQEDIREVRRRVTGRRTKPALPPAKPPPRG